MSYPDYQQCAEDHQCLLIVVKQIGPQISQKLFNRIYEGISKLCEISISDAQGMGFERTIRVRYKRSYNIENNDWGDFQAHRRVLGLITVGKSFNDNEVESICELHNTIRETFANTLYDSRCFIVNSTSDTNHTNHDLNVTTETQSSAQVLTNESSNDCPIKRTSISDNNDYFDDLDSINKVRDIAKAFTSAGDDILEGYDISERLPSCADEPIVNDEQLMITHVNIDSSESSPESIDEMNAHNGLTASSLDSSSNTSPTKSLQNLSLNNNNSNNNSNNFLSNTFLPNSEPINASLTKSQLTQYIRYDNDQECCDKIENNVRDFISSLFWVLESKRLDRTHEKQDKVPLLIAPFEKKDLIGLDTDTRTFRKRCLGRMRKHIADLSLLAGLPSEALTHYSSAIDQLRAVSDWLWLASALEGQCVASLALLYPNSSRRRRSLAFQRNASLPLAHNSNTSNSKNGKNRKLPNINHPLNNTKSLPNGLDPIFSKAFGKSILTQNDIYEKYKEAACQYAKYRNAAILEFECSFKAARVLTDLEKYLFASEFIQNAVFITFNQTNEEQIERLSMIADLYSNIGYLRKAAFYRRFAALKAVSLHLQNPNWEKCYYLLLPSLEGYGLTLDPMEYQRRISSNSIGWPGIHMQLLQELVTTSMKMSCEPLAVRHLSFLLHSLFDHLSVKQREEFSSKLFSLSSRCGEGSPVPLKLQNGAVIPSVNLTKFPTVISFKVQNLAPHLQPFKLKKLKTNVSLNPSNPPSPFIFTPLQFNRSNANTPRKFSTAATVLDFKWSEGEISKVSVTLQNFLPIELNISHMAIMTDGLAFETYPTSLSIGAEAVSTTINLTGIPRASGKLDILGYSTHALGVKSDCRMKELPNAKKMKLPNVYTIEVIPFLPLMGINCSLPKSNQFSTLLANDGNHIDYSAAISLFAGEKRCCQITLTNNSPNSELIELINVEVISKLPKQSEKSLFEWLEDSINNELPLACGSSVTFDLTINAIGGFVIESNSKKDNSSGNKSATASGTQSPYVSHHNSPLHTGGTNAAKKSQLLGSTTLANFISELQTSNKQKRNDKIITNNLEPYPSKVVEALLLFEYSGGPGLASGYCRHSSLAITIEIQPSLLITHWDVLPADQPTNCFLVLDALNATNHEMELFYATNKEILIESKETCRIPVPIERCPLVEDNSCDDNEDSNLLSRCRAHLVNQVNLNWMLSASGIRGDASIVNVPYSDEMLNSILLSPIQWEVSLNDQTFRSGNEFTFKVGEFISLSISLYNCSGSSLKSLNVVIHYYQDYQNSHRIGKERNYRLDMKKALTGFDRVFIPEIQSKQSYLHECGLTFFYTGIYKLDIQCDTSSDSSDSSISSKKHKLLSNTDFIESKTSCPKNSLWKCSPSIEISIE